MNTTVKRILAGLAAAPLVVALGLPLRAQAPAPGAQAQGPIDIQANEQEFAGDEVIARGDVHVKYKDSVVLAPQARLIRDSGGNPQRAVFTGHPHLTQGNNRIDAETLTFEVATSHVLAEGHAHSEVVDNGPADNKSGTANGGGKKNDDPGKQSDSAAKTSNSKTKPDTTSEAKQPTEKIITDSDRQEYDRSSGKFLAQGHVRVLHGNIFVKADKLQLNYGLDNKPETALFTGNVAATQDKNTTIADSMTYSLSTHRLQATGHVKSTVIQEKKDPPPKKKTAFDGDLMQSATATEVSGTPEAAQDEKIVITSETQDFSRDTNRMSANGNVRIYYQDMIGAGPAAILIRNSLNKPERIVFSGRSQISQPSKRWIADHIEMTVVDKKVIATGNTKAIILQAPKGAPATTGSQLAGKGDTTK